MAIAATIAFGLFVIGFKRHRKTRPHRYRLAAIAAGLCIASPFLTFGLAQPEPAFHFRLSLFGAVTGVMALALFARLNPPSRRFAPVLPRDLSEHLNTTTQPVNARAETLPSQRSGDMPNISAHSVDAIQGSSNATEHEPFARTARARLSQELDETELAFAQLREQTLEPLDLPRDAPWIEETELLDLTSDEIYFDKTHVYNELSKPVDPDASNSDVADDIDWHDDSDLTMDVDAIAGGAPRTTRPVLGSVLNATETLGTQTAFAAHTDQQRVIDTLRSDVHVLQRHIDRLESALQERDADIQRLSASAHHAAQLARQAAEARCKVQAVLEEERSARANQEAATQRAVAVARNAIAALNERTRSVK